jgi:hypothetical protein
MLGRVVFIIDIGINIIVVARRLLESGTVSMVRSRMVARPSAAASDVVAFAPQTGHCLSVCCSETSTRRPTRAGGGTSPFPIHIAVPLLRPCPDFPPPLQRLSLNPNRHISHCRLFRHITWTPRPPLGELFFLIHPFLYLATDSPVSGTLYSRPPSSSHGATTCSRRILLASQRENPTPQLFRQISCL